MTPKYFTFDQVASPDLNAHGQDLSTNDTDIPHNIASRAVALVTAASAAAVAGAVASAASTPTAADGKNYSEPDATATATAAAIAAEISDIVSTAVAAAVSAAVKSLADIAEGAAGDKPTDTVDNNLESRPAIDETQPAVEDNLEDLDAIMGETHIDTAEERRLLESMQRTDEESKNSEQNKVRCMIIYVC